MQKALRECEWHRGNEARECLENKMAAVDCFLEDTKSDRNYFGILNSILEPMEPSYNN
jgi:hypothetical protein